VTQRRYRSELEVTPRLLDAYAHAESPHARDRSYRRKYGWVYVQARTDCPFEALMLPCASGAEMTLPAQRLPWVFDAGSRLRRWPRLRRSAAVMLLYWLVPTRRV
jgi:hypothetical protein